MIENDIMVENNDCYILCHVCTNPIASCSTGKGEVRCPRCNHVNKRRKPKDPNKTLGYALAALILYFPANFFPFMTIEMYGNKSEATIWSGIVSLSEGGSWFLAIIIFIASMLVPFIKLAALFYLSLTGRSPKHRNFRTKLFHFIEVIGPWSMLDVFLLAVLVAVVKFDMMASVYAGEGSFMFLLVVILTMLASANFDPKIIWEEEVENEEI